MRPTDLPVETVAVRREKGKGTAYETLLNGRGEGGDRHGVSEGVPGQVGSGTFSIEEIRESLGNRGDGTPKNGKEL